MLEPRTSGLVARRMAGHPVGAFAAAAVIGFVVLAALACLGGWLLQTYVLPDRGIGHADEHVNVWLAQHRTGLRNSVSYWVSGAGDVYAIPALVALGTVVALIRRKWRVAAFVVTAIAVEAATYRVATLVIQRPRPAVPRLDQLPVDASYYSGHTAASVAVYCGLALVVTAYLRSTGLRVAVWVVALAMPLLVGLARMYRGMHHPTDVASGLVIGVGSLLVAIAAARSAKAAESAQGRAS